MFSYVVQSGSILIVLGFNHYSYIHVIKDKSLWFSINWLETLDLTIILAEKSLYSPELSTFLFFCRGSLRVSSSLLEPMWRASSESESEATINDNYILSNTREMKGFKTRFYIKCHDLSLVVCLNLMMEVNRFRT